MAADFAVTFWPLPPAAAAGAAPTGGVLEGAPPAPAQGRGTCRWFSWEVVRGLQRGRAKVLEKVKGL